MAAIWCGGRCAIGAIGSSMSCRCSGAVQIAVVPTSTVCCRTKQYQIADLNLIQTQKAKKPVAWAAGHLDCYTARGLHGSPGPRLRRFRRRDRGAQENFPNFIICDESARTATAVGSWAAVSFGLARPTGVDRPRRHDLGLQCARCRLRGGAARVAGQRRHGELTPTGRRALWQAIDSSDDGGASWSAQSWLASPQLRSIPFAQIPGRCS